MVAVITTVWDQIETDWEGLTPPDRTGVTYHRVTGKSVLDGTAGDRSFWFEVAPGGRTISAESTADTRVVWRTIARILLSASGRGVEGLNEAIANEGNLLCRQVENRTSWPAGVWEVMPPRWEGQDITTNGDVILRLEIEAECGESD